MVGKDHLYNKISLGDLVLVDFRASFSNNSRSLNRSIGEVVTGGCFGFDKNEYFVKVSKPKKDKVVYLEINSWQNHIEKIERNFSEDIISLYF